MARLKQKLSYLLLGQQGGTNRIKIIDLLKERPYNINQMANELNLNYRTVKHHIDVLMEHDLLTTSRSGGYGEVYFLTSDLKNNLDLYEDMKEKQKDIKTSTELYQKVVEQIHNGLIIFDEDKDVIFINKNGEKIIGYSDEEILGNKIDFITQDDFIEESIEKISEGKKVAGEEIEAVNKQNEKIYLRASVNKIENEKVLGYSIVFEDITEKKRLEKQIKENERRYRELFDQSPIGIWEEDFSVVKKKIDSLKERGVKDVRKYLDDNPEFLEELIRNVKIVSINNSVLDMYKAESVEEFKNGLSDIFGERSIRSFKEVIEHIAEGKTEYMTDKVDKTLEGDDIHIFLKWSVVSGYEDTYSKVIVSTIDITERKNKEEKLKKSEERLRRSQSVANVGTWEIDLNTWDISWSDESYRIFGVPIGEEMDYEKFLSIVHPEDRDYVDRKWNRALDTGEYDIDHRIIVDGEVKWVREKADIRYDEDGEPVDVIGSVQDITKRKNAMERIEFLNSLIASIKDVNQELVKNDDFSDTLQKVPEILLRTRGFANITLAMFDDEDIMYPVSNSGEHEIGSWKFTREGEGEDAPGCIIEAINNKEEIIVEEPRDFCNNCQLLHDIPEHKTAVIPMVLDGSVIGVIRACYEPEIEIDEKTLELLHEVAGDLVFAYKNIK